MSFVSGSNSAFSSSSFFFLVLVLDVQALLGRGLQLLAIELLKLLHTVLIHRVNHVEHLQALLAQSLQEWRGRHCSDALTCDVVDIVLAL